MTRIATLLSTSLLAAWLTTSAASAAIHTVAPGETLWSIAQADGISPQALAAANGLPADAHVLATSTLTIPAGGGAAGAQPSLAPVAGEPLGDDNSPLAAQPVASGGYLVQPGDTLSAIAARLGVSSGSLAAANNLALDGVLLGGTSLAIPGQAAGTRPVVATGTAAPSAGTGAPSASPGFVSGSQIAGVAAANGVPPSLAQAVAWQESGFNNGVVSSANARGVMQIIPSTWRFVQSNLAPSPLDPFSPIGNVKGGVLLLHYLLNSTGDPATAIAGYYQGLGSVRRDGVLPETQRYVANVLALSRRFGGP